ncbi:MAG: hypothetical protein WAT81_01485 [Candidatus Moraniibacteriota bacterium]
MFETPKPPQEKPKVPKQGLSWKLVRVGSAAANAMWEHVDNPDAPSPHETLLDNRQGKFVRAQALFSVLRDAIPDPLFKKLTGGHYEYKGDVLPIDPALYRFEAEKVGNGAECNVYKLISLDPERPTLVIKIDIDVRRSVDVLVARGKQIRDEYEEKKEWYRELPDLIPEEMQFISKSPRGGRNALFTIQEYFGTADQIHDLFRGQTKTELIALLKRDPELRVQFQTFARITLERAADQDEVIDTLGDKNVVLVDQPDGHQQLRLLDPHVVKYPKRPVNANEEKLILADLDFLREVSAALEEKS